MHYSRLLVGIFCFYSLLSYYSCANSESHESQLVEKETPLWAIPYGGEFWRRPVRNGQAGNMRTEKGVATVSPEIDIGDVIDRVSHAITLEPEPTVTSKSYRAIFSGQGIDFYPYVHGQESSYSPVVGSFQTLDIQRGRQKIFHNTFHSPPWFFVGNVAQKLVGTIVEHYEASNEGIKLTWMLRKEPEGHGDLVLRQQVSGVEFCGKTKSGIHFMDSSGTARIRIGPVNIMDSRGQTWLVGATYEMHILTINVPEAILENASYPLVVDPYIGPEFGMDEPVTGSGEAHYNPAVAFDGTYYFIAWYDSIGGFRGARFNTSGEIQDPVGLQLSITRTGFIRKPEIATNGTTFLVVWSTPEKTYGARIRGSDGVVLDQQEIVICTSCGIPSVASDGNMYLVIWRDRVDTSYVIFGARIDGNDGTIIDPGGVPLYFFSEYPDDPSVASNGSDFLIVWEEGIPKSIRGMRIRGADLAVIDPAVISIPGDSRTAEDVAVASNGTDYLVVWQNRVSGVDIYGSRIRASDGAVLDPDGIAICTASSDQNSPAVSSNGDDYLVVWQDERDTWLNEDIYGARVNAVDGSVLDADGFAVSAGDSSLSTPDVSSDGTDYFVVWHDRDGHVLGYLDIYGTRIRATDGAVLDQDGIHVSPAANNEVHPSLAHAGDNFLVVWTDNRNFESTGFDIYGTRVESATGSILDPSGISICSEQWNQHSPSAGSGGGNYLIVWHDQRDSRDYGDVYGTRVRAADGVVLDQNGIVISTAVERQESPKVASDGTNFFVVWDDFRLNADIYGARIRSNDGTNLDPNGIPICVENSSQWNSSIASSGNIFLVSWLDTRNSNQYYDIYGARVSASDGDVLDPDGIAINIVDETPSALSSGSDRNGFFVVWQSGSGIFGSRLRATDGTVLDPNGITICAETGQRWTPKVASDGTTHLVVWDDYRQGLVNNHDIFAARVRAHDGVVLDPRGFVISSSISGERYPSVVYGGNHFLVAYDTNVLGARRVKARFVDIRQCTANDDGTPCEDGNYCTVDETCLSGACVGGTAIDCSDAVTEPQCQVSICDEDADLCLAEVDNEGQPCNDGAYCTLGDMCRSGTCIGDSDRDCSAVVTDSQCEIPFCDDTVDSCVALPFNEGEPCDDGQYCSARETCQLGDCLVTEQRDCSSVVTEPQCQTPACDETNNACIAEPINEGHSCNDGAYCTVDDNCMSGSCVGVARDCSSAVNDWQCQAPRCDEATDRCVPDSVNDGTGCEDGSYCSIGEKCHDGTCTGGIERDCSHLIIWKTCQTAHCDENINECVVSPKNEGVSCNDRNLCTVGDTCRNGVCLGGSPQDCSVAISEPQCQVARCDEWRGMCVVEEINNGRVCKINDLCGGDAVCVKGKCVALRNLCDTQGGGCACGAASLESRSLPTFIILMIFFIAIRRFS